MNYYYTNPQEIETLGKQILNKLWNEAIQLFSYVNAAQPQTLLNAVFIIDNILAQAEELIIPSQILNSQGYPILYLSLKSYIPQLINQRTLYYNMLQNPNNYYRYPNINSIDDYNNIIKPVIDNMNKVSEDNYQKWREYILQ